MSDDRDDEPVGYGRPPRAHRFQKGQSGNRNGRPRKPKDLATLILRELDAMVTVRVNGRDLRMTHREAIVKQYINRALRGDPKQVDAVIRFCRENGIAEPLSLSAEDRARFDVQIEDMAMSRLKKEVPDDQGDPS